MSCDPRFGLPLSLVEALEMDPSPQAADLAQLLREPGAAKICRRRRVVAWSAPMAALAGALAVSLPSYAATTSLVGRWVLSPERSTFAESFTGLAPDQATVEVSQDGADGFAYQVVESRGGVEVARAAYTVSYAAGTATSRMGRAVVRGRGGKDAAGAVVITAPEVEGLRASIRFRRTGDNTAEIEHAVEGPQGSTPLETLRLTRATMARAD